jgi:predicted esterase
MAEESSEDRMKQHHPQSAKFPITRTLFVAVTCATLGCPLTTPPALHEVTVIKDTVYAIGIVSDGLDPVEWQEAELALDVYIPDAKGLNERPALLLVHGGNFFEGNKEKLQIVEYANFFAERGYVCFAMNYRLQGDYPPAPEDWSVFSLTSAAHAAMVDVKAAIRFIRANADAYSVDANRIGLLGESAGAIAGVTAAVTPADLFSTDGPSFPTPPFNNPGVSPKVQAYVHLWGSADHVLLNVNSTDPPIMIVHGEEDTTPFAAFPASERLHTVVDLWDIPHEFYAAKDAGHGAWDYILRGKDLKTLTLEFLDEYLMNP